MSKGNSGRSSIVITKNAVIRDCDVGVSIGQGVDVKIAGLLERCKQAVVHRDPQSLVQELGLPAETPTEELIAVIQALRSNPDASDKDMEKALESTGLWGWIQRSADTVTVIQGVIALAKSGLALAPIL